MNRVAYRGAVVPASSASSASTSSDAGSSGWAGPVGFGRSSGRSGASACIGCGRCPAGSAGSDGTGRLGEAGASQWPAPLLPPPPTEGATGGTVRSSVEVGSPGGVVNATGVNVGCSTGAAGSVGVAMGTTSGVTLDPTVAGVSVVSSTRVSALPTVARHLFLNALPGRCRRAELAAK